MKQLFFFLCLLPLFCISQDTLLIRPSKAVSSSNTISLKANQPATGNFITIKSVSVSNVVLNNGLFNFSIAGNLSTSAGVYDVSGTLVRTLWSGVNYSTGTYQKQWDGLLDDGTQALPGIYTIKVQTNAVSAVFEGGIGNTSNGLLGKSNTWHGGKRPIAGIAFADNTKGVYLNGQSEGGITVCSFASNNIQTRNIFNPNSVNISPYQIVTNGTTYFIGGQYQDLNPRRNCVYGVRATDGGVITFSNGVPAASSPSSLSISSATDGSADISSLAVQPNAGKYLFVAREGINQIQVLDISNNSGTTAQTITTPFPHFVACTTDGKLWVARGLNATPLDLSYVAASRLTGTPFNSDIYGGDGSHGGDKVQDGNLTTYFNSASSAGGYVGLDLGTAKTISSVAITPRPGLAERFLGAVIQGSNISSTSGYVDLYTINYKPAENQLTAFPVNATTAFRYVRIIMRNTYCEMTELAFFSNYTVPLTGIDQYTVNFNGSITPTGLTIPASENVGMAVSATNELAVADNITSQIKFYNASTGAFISTLGQFGGYKNSPTVTYDKFMFTLFQQQIYVPKIAYQPDGSLWVVDAGNFRTLHFNSDKTYKEQIAWIISMRIMQLDKNDPTRVFALYNEFKRDYSKPLDNGANGSWKLVNNWSYGLNDLYTEFDGLYNVITIGGRTLELGGRTELTATGRRRLDDIGDLGDFTITQDGTLEITRQNIVNNKTYFSSTERAFTGWVNDKPTWGIETPFTLAAARNSDSDPFPFNSDAVTNTGNNPAYKVFFQKNPSDPASGFHLGVVKRLTNTWVWRAVRGTESYQIDHSESYNYYTGGFPRDGGMDQGDKISVSNLANTVVHGNDVVWRFARDFYKGSSFANIFNLYNLQTGLFVKNWGSTWDEQAYGDGLDLGYSGNAYITQMVNVNGDLYVYCSDEGTKNMVFCYKVSNRNSIAVQSKTLIVTGAVTKQTDATDMMAGVPYHSTTWYGGNGWTVFPASPVGFLADYPSWVVLTTKNTYLKDDVDIHWLENGSADPNAHYITRTLPVTNSNNWGLSGQILVEHNDNPAYIEVLDDQGKILTQLRFAPGGIILNGTTVKTGDYYNLLYYTGLFQNFTLKNTNGIATFSYKDYFNVTLNAPFETGGNFNKPAKFRVRVFGSHGVSGGGSIKGLKFTGSVISK